MEYNPQEIEEKWQKAWEEIGLFRAKDFSKRRKFYCLDMFPYPSAEGLHVGHPRGYLATDIISHLMRRKGFNVLHPMGWDAFGLPAENYAIKTGVNPSISTRKNIQNFKRQIKSIGLSYDWSREINTTDPEYYKWTQWIFLLLYKMGLAYEATLPINFCPSCKTGLANEEVLDGECERCGSKVIKKDMRQWVLKITAYADKLLKDLDSLDWPERIKEMQRNWIGRSEGWEVKFLISNSQLLIPVFTTRADTIFGATYIVLAPENPIIKDLKSKIENWESVEQYIEKAKNKSDRERVSEIKEKTGVELKGIKAINPANSREVLIFVADYVLPYYGTGAVMAVPCHDQRDFDFARRFNLSMIEVINPYEKSRLKKENLFASDDGRFECAFEEEGILINSGRFDGMKSEEAKEQIGKWLSSKNLAKKTVQYKLRDWIFSRQRYWGEPIPIVHCKNCGVVSLSENDLPLKLPRVKNYQPTGTGESPLASIKSWIKTKCPKCKGSAERETNTMPQWAGSCWYFLRYIDPQNKEKIFDQKKINLWLPVDLYVGGAEHAVLHLLYARFWNKVLYDAGLIKFKEPFLKLKNQGLILAPDGQKMSKSRGNVISPDDLVQKYGADAFRLYEMFMGPFSDAIIWDVKGIVGTKRFLEKVWRLFDIKREIISAKEDKELDRLVHKTIKKVTDDILNFRFNTAVSALMVLVNGFQNKNYGIWHLKTLLLLLSPFAPHICEELWQNNFIENKDLNFKIKNSIHSQPWPKYNAQMAKEEIVTLIIQVNGRVRDKMEVEADIPEEKVKELALVREKIQKWTYKEKIKKVIFVPGKLINIVVE